MIVEWDCGCRFEGKSNIVRKQDGTFENLADTHCKTHNWATVTKIISDHLFYNKIFL